MERIKNPDLPNRHHAIIGKSGSYKTGWLKKNRELKTAARLVLWDPDEGYTSADFPGLVRVESLSALDAALDAAGSGSIKIALTVDPSTANFDLFLQLMRCYASADRVTYLLLEEVSTPVPMQFNSEAWRWIWTASRKYGLIVWAVTHSPVGVDKLMFRQAAWKWISGIDDDSDRQKISKLVEIPADQLRNLHIKPAKGGAVLEYVYGSVASGFKHQNMRLPPLPK